MCLEEGRQAVVEVLICNKSLMPVKARAKQQQQQQTNKRQTTARDAHVCLLQTSAVAGGEHGQTREHAQLARSLGVEQLVVVVTKLDMAGYSQVKLGLVA
jgi:sulfate adenylyltransferase subunit 1 (EFTu-like GTPase family)